MESATLENRIETETGRYEHDLITINEVVKRIAEWPNPVELVNNLYGCHPGSDGIKDYFEEIYQQ